MAGQSAPSPRRGSARNPPIIGLVYASVVAATTAIIGGTVLYGTRLVLLDDAREYLVRNTATAAALIDPALVSTLTRPDQGRSREYATAVRPLRAMMQADSSVRRAFAAIVVGDSMRYVLDGAQEGRIGRDGRPEHHAIGVTVQAPPGFVQAWASRTANVTEETVETLWGPAFRAAAPIGAADGRMVAIVTIVFSMERYRAQIAQLDDVVFMGGAVGLLLALLLGIAAYRVESERLTAEAGLRAAKFAAEASARAKGEFVANMSHEIRTPLHGVLGMSEAMLASAHTEADRRSLEVINKSASSLLGILNDILDYSKLEAGRVDLVNAPFDPRALVDDVTDLFAVKAEEKGLELAVRETLRAERWPEGDAARLKQVLLNLVGNGVKFTETGHVLVELETVMIGRKTIALRISVKDTGIGIALEAQSKLFEQFSQAEASTARRFGGTGLGLAISRQLVLRMGGTLTVESDVPGGAQFLVDLQLPAANEGRPAGADARLPPGSRALVWCARPLTCDAVVEMLTRQGIGVDTCDSEAAMLARLKSPVSYALVLVDMPASGEVVPPPLIGVRGAPPLVLLTSLHKPLNNSGLAKFGAAGQLRRPVREDHLEALLDEVATGRLSSRQVEATQKAASDPPPEIDRLAANLGSAAKSSVLVVDDVELNLMVARAMLGSLGVQVTGANGGRSALEQLARERFDLVFMDCHMPEIDGYEVTRRVRTSPGPNQKTPIVALSASAFAEDRERALMAGMNDFAPKPIELHGLRSVLLKWVPGYAATVAPRLAATVA